MPQSITVVLADGTIWSAASSSFTQVIAPAQSVDIADVIVEKADGSKETLVPETNA